MFKITGMRSRAPQGETSLQDLKTHVAGRCNEIDRETVEIISKCKWQQGVEAVNSGRGQP